MTRQDPPRPSRTPALHPRVFVHPFADPDAGGACRQHLGDRACNLPEADPCHQWPLSVPAATVRAPGTPTGDGSPPSQELETARARVADLEDLLGALWLYTSWGSVTRQLTTQQRNLWADVIDVEHARDDVRDGYVGTHMAHTPLDRWWAAD